MEVLDFPGDELLILLYHLGIANDGHVVAAKLQDDEPGVGEGKTVLHQRLVDAVENGARRAPQRHIVHGYALRSIGPYRINFGIAGEADHSFFHGTREVPGEESDAAFARGFDGLRPKGVAGGFYGKIGRRTPVEHAYTAEGLYAFAGVFIAAVAQGDGAAAGELNHLSQRTIAAVSGTHGGGISVHGVLYKTAIGHLADTGRRDVAKGGEEPRSYATESALEGFPQVLRNTVQFYLRVSVVKHAHHSALGLLHLPKQAIEEGVVVIRQINAVWILIEELAVVLQGVVFHFEAACHGLQHGIHVHLALMRLLQRPLIGCKTQVDRPHGYALRRHSQPQHAHHGEHAQKKYEYLTRFQSFNAALR